jgi:hypothetical protein
LYNFAFQRRYFILLRSPDIDSKESISPAYVAREGWYENPLPTRFIDPIDCCKIPAQDFYMFFSTCDQGRGEVGRWAMGNGHAGRYSLALICI